MEPPVLNRRKHLVVNLDFVAAKLQRDRNIKNKAGFISRAAIFTAKGDRLLEVLPITSLTLIAMLK